MKHVSYGLAACLLALGSPAFAQVAPPPPQISYPLEFVCGGDVSGRHYAISFQPNDAALDDVSRGQIACIANTSRGASSIAVTGFQGPDETTSGLSAERARAVAEALEAAGIDPAVIQVTACGKRLNETLPMYDGANRRVDISIDNGKDTCPYG